MSQLTNTSSLFQTSLRRWQQEFKAHRAEGDAPATQAPVARRLLGAAATRHASRRQGRVGQSTNASARA